MKRILGLLILVFSLTACEVKFSLLSISKEIVDEAATKMPNELGGESLVPILIDSKQLYGWWTNGTIVENFKGVGKFDEYTCTMSSYGNPRVESLDLDYTISTTLYQV